MAMIYEFGGGFGKVGQLVRFWFGEYFCCGVFATIFGIGCGTVTSWNESFKSLPGVEKLIIGFWDGGSCRKVFGKWKDCWRSGFADTVLACLCEVLDGCENSNSPPSGNGNSFAIFCGLLLDVRFLFWVASICSGPFEKRTFWNSLYSWRLRFS